MSEVELREKAKLVDLNDLQLADEQVNIDGDADAFAGPPPPDDGDHRVKLSMGPQKVLGGKDKNGKPFYMVSTQAKLTVGQWENRVVFDNPSSMVMQNTGTSRIAGILKALGDPVGGRVGILDVVRKYADKLAGEPEVLVQTQWTAYCKDCQDEAKANNGRSKAPKSGIVLRGQKRFPETEGGSHRHQIECPNCGSMLSARAEIVAYKPLPPEA